MRIDGIRNRGKRTGVIFALVFPCSYLFYQVCKMFVMNRAGKCNGMKVRRETINGIIKDHLKISDAEISVTFLYYNFFTGSID